MPRGLVSSAHAAAFLFIVLPLIDYGSNVWAPRFGDERWRYGAVGLLSSYLLTPILGLLLHGFAGVVARQRRLLSVLAWTSGLAGILVLAGILLFGLDTLQLAGSVPPEAKSVFKVGAVKAALKLLAMGLWVVGFAWVVLRAARAMQAPAKEGVDPALVIRRPGAAKVTAD